jgi:hypothetical protein
MSFRRTASLGITQALQDAILEALLADPGAPLMDAPRLNLIANPDAVLSKDYDPADIAADDPTFTGYASVLLTPGDFIGPINLGGGKRGMHLEVDIVSTAVPTAQMVYGYVITDTGTTILYGWEVFEDPVPIVNPGDSVSLDIVLAMGSILQAE